MGVKRKSAVSCRRLILYSARDVIMRYGSSVPLVVKSSISTPIYASSRPSTNGGFFKIL